MREVVTAERAELLPWTSLGAASGLRRSSLSLSLVRLVRAAVFSPLLRLEFGLGPRARYSASLPLLKARGEFSLLTAALSTTPLVAAGIVGQWRNAPTEAADVGHSAWAAESDADGAPLVCMGRRRDSNRAVGPSNEWWPPLAHTTRPPRPGGVGWRPPRAASGRSPSPSHHSTAASDAQPDCSAFFMQATAIRTLPQHLVTRASVTVHTQQQQQR